jgi:4'-phosphopantetheinyl transferase
LSPEGAPGWPTPASWPELAADEVHLWFVSLEVEPERLRTLSAFLNEAERARAARFVFEHHRRRWAAGRGLVRELLGRYLGAAPAGIEFELGPLGKPYLRAAGGAPQLQFNYADADGAALFGFARGVELGVDLESLAREVNHLEIAERHFHASEVAALNRTDDASARAAFLACWTRKEAWGKAKGVGIRYPLDGVILCGSPERETLAVDDPDSAGRWRLAQLHPAPDYIGAAVYAGTERPLRCFSYPKWQT